MKDLKFLCFKKLGMLTCMNKNLETLVMSVLLDNPLIKIMQSL